MKLKVLVIVGPTASGKTSLSIQIARAFSGEVISADSRQVYRGIDLCSGKVTKEEIQGVPHHLLDVVDPMTIYTVSDFKRAATAAILDIQNRSRLPIVAGGTFLYTDTLLGKISVPKVPPNEALRAILETKCNEELFSQLTVLDPVRAATIDKDNPRRLIRAIEVATALGAVPPMQTNEPYHSLTLGIDIDQETLHHNIHVRIKERLDAGMVAEVEQLLASGVTHERLESLGLECRYISRYLRGEMASRLHGYKKTTGHIYTKSLARGLRSNYELG
jgi:tRNA dimethylallyltransferase